MAEYNWYNPMTWDMQNNPAYRAGKSYYDLTRGENAPPQAGDPWALAKDIGPLYTKFINDKLKGFNYPTPNLTMPNNILNNFARKKDLPYDDYNADRFSNLNNLATDTYPNTGAQFTEDTDPYSEAKKNFITNKFLMRDTDALTNQEDYTQSGQKVSETGEEESTGFQWPSIFGGIMRAAAEKFKDNPEEAFGRDYFNLTDTGRIAGNPATDLYSGTNVSTMFGEGVDAAGQKRIDKIQGTLDKWESDEEKYAKQIATTTLYDRLKNFKKQQARYQNKLNAQTGPVEPPVITSRGDQVNTGGGYSPGYSTRGGFTGKADPTSGGVRGHHGNWADGGRIGYAFAGPVGVEQQTDFIQGPQGGEEFQETVVEGQEQPSREQLEALAMEIYQLPLEELDEQQLVVVYQAAMQGQPMEEAVQEEDVQFAANGGLAGLL